MPTALATDTGLERLPVLVELVVEGAGALPPSGGLGWLEELAGTGDALDALDAALHSLGGPPYTAGCSWRADGVSVHATAVLATSNAAAASCAAPLPRARRGAAQNGHRGSWSKT